MQSISESAAETAKKIRKELKLNFPGIKFSVTSENYSGGSSVNVHWTDGPMEKGVSTITSRFNSASFDGMTDSESRHGYMYEGVRYNGASYVFATRRLSPELKIQLDAKCLELFGEPDRGGYLKRQHSEAERALLGIEEEPAEAVEPESIKPSNVINFGDRRADKWNDSLTPEQRLKLACLSDLLPEDEILNAIVSGVSIDRIFTLAAEKMYENYPKAGE